MNYRHAYHAGNFADVFKHALLTRILLYLMRKPAPLRFIDTHAGIGLYDLGGDEATRTGEWRGGIARMSDMPQGAARDLLQPWLDVVGPLDAQGQPILYPGSPALAQALLRKQDRMTFSDLHPGDAQMLAQNMGRDKRVQVVTGDGYKVLIGMVPPNERRGLVLIDPPFEQPGEFGQMETALLRAQRKWREGVFALWYPLKDGSAEMFFARLVASGMRRLLRLHISIGDARSPGLRACGLLIVNPPFVLEAEARIILPALVQAMADGQNGSHAIDWLATE